MKKFLLSALLIMGLAAHAAADDVTVNVTYPSLYGSYGNLEIDDTGIAAYSDTGLRLKAGFLRIQRSGGASAIFRSNPTALLGEFRMETAHPFVFRTNGTEMMSINSVGNIAINGRSQGGRFEVHSPYNSTTNMTSINSDANVSMDLRNAAGPSIMFSTNGATQSSTVTLTDDDTFFIGQNRLGINVAAPAAALQVYDALNSQILTGNWGELSSGVTSGYFCANCHSNPTNSQMKYTFTHASLGAVGVGMNYPSANKVTFFTSGTASSTKDQVFTPVPLLTLAAGPSDKTYAGLGTTSPEAGFHIFNSAGRSELHLTGAGNGDFFSALWIGATNTANSWNIDFKDYGGNASQNSLAISYKGGAGLIPHVRWQPSNGAMRISSNIGGVDMGSVAQASLHVDGEAFRNGALDTWDPVSDRRLKHDIAPLENSLEKILKLRGVTFKWNEPEKHGGEKGVQMGLIAQEAEEVFPEWVQTGPDGYKMMDYKGYEAIAFEAIKSEAAKSRALADRTLDAEKRFEALRLRAERLS